MPASTKTGGKLDAVQGRLAMPRLIQPLPKHSFEPARRTMPMTDTPVIIEREAFMAGYKKAAGFAIEQLNAAPRTIAEGARVETMKGA
jgi:hypothetical protein